MAKLIFVPQWLSELLTETSTPVFKLAAHDVNTSIVSKDDVINYQKAQIEFLKVLRKYSDSMKVDMLAVCSLMYHPIQYPEVELYLNTVSKDNDPNLDFLQVDSLSHLDYTVEHDPTKNVVYIIGKYSDSPDWVKGEHSNFTLSVLSDILQAAHTHQRIENQTTDKASALRDSPILTQFYVNSIVS
jgi:hypothetical protein